MISRVLVELEIQVHLSQGPVEPEILGPVVIPEAKGRGREKGATVHLTRILIQRPHGTKH